MGARRTPRIVESWGQELEDIRIRRTRAGMKTTKLETQNSEINASFGDHRTVLVKQAPHPMKERCVQSSAGR